MKEYNRSMSGSRNHSKFYVVENELRVYSETFEELKVLDTFESLLWNERYEEYNDFELYTYADKKFVDLLTEGRYIGLRDTNELMIIERTELQTSTSEGDKYLVTGRGMESLMDRRIIWSMLTYSGNVYDLIVKLMNENFINPSDPKRKMGNFTLDVKPTRLKNIKIERQFHGEYLGEVIKEICAEYHIGVKVIYERVGKMTFTFYEGVDRGSVAAETSGPLKRVLFSQFFDNLLDSTFSKSSIDYRNSILIIGEGEGAEAKTTSYHSEDRSGMHRREMSYSASASSSTEDGDIPEAEYIALILAEGKKELALAKKENVFEGSVQNYGKFVLNRDYHMGDIVAMGNDYQTDTRVRVIEVIRSLASNDNTIYPTFRSLADEENKGG